MEQANKPLKEEMIELLIFNKEDIQQNKISFKWIHSREFKFNDNMYDIVEKKETETELIIYCINDTEEKKLEEEFEKKIHRNSIEDKQIPTSNSLNFVSISEPAESEKPNSLLFSESTLSFWSTEFYQSLNLDIASPPPRLV